MNGVDLINNLIDELGRAREILRDLGNEEDSVNELVNDIRTDLDRYYDVADSIDVLLEDLEVE